MSATRPAPRGRIRFEGDADLVAFVRLLPNPCAWLRTQGYDVTVRAPTLTKGNAS